jgi:membrane protease YdiL (CAAX protease family)
MTDLTISDPTAWNTVQEENQYSLAKILAIWLAAALPMGLLSWVVYPALAPDFETDALGAGFTRTAVLAAGLIWVFVLALIIVYREEGDLRWPTLRRRLWLNTPRDPQSGKPSRKLWLWLIPISIMFPVVTFLIGPPLGRLWNSLFPFFAPPPGFDPGQALGSPEAQAQFVGAWDFLLLFVVMAFFNIFGEEFLFRGVILPKMGGAFGKWDWVANGVLMGAYHWHQPWAMAGTIVASVFLFAFPARLFRSTWMALITHALQYLLFIPLILAIVLGLA